jgi:hypothetical protein
VILEHAGLQLATFGAAATQQKSIFAMPFVRVPVSFKTTAFHSQYQRILTILVDLLELSSL